MGWHGNWRSVIVEVVEPIISVAPFRQIEIFFLKKLNYGIGVDRDVRSRLPVLCFPGFPGLMDVWAPKLILDDTAKHDFFCPISVSRVTFCLISTVTIYAFFLSSRLESQVLGKLGFRQLRVSHSILRVGYTSTVQYWKICPRRAEAIKLKLVIWLASLMEIYDPRIWRHNV